MECTTLSFNNSSSFVEAVQMGQSHLDNYGGLFYAIDVHQAQSNCLKPIPIPEENGEVDLSIKPIELHEGGEVEEYGIGTFVYYRRPGFDLNKFDHFVATKWPKKIIRAKGVCYFSKNRDMSYLFEQAGVQKKLTEAGQWYATAPEEDLIQMMQQEPDLMRDWDEKYGDRMIKIVFIGQHLDGKQLARELDACLE